MRHLPREKRSFIYLKAVGKEKHKRFLSESMMKKQNIARGKRIGKIKTPGRGEYIGDLITN